VYPALHTQSVTLALPLDSVEALLGHATQAALDLAASSLEYVPMSHAEHSPGPGLALYLPAAQAAHVPLTSV
jgi:hypothetical protein